MKDAAALEIKMSKKDFNERVARFQHRFNKIKLNFPLEVPIISELQFQKADLIILSLMTIPDLRRQVRAWDETLKQITNGLKQDLLLFAKTLIPKENYIQERLELEKLLKEIDEFIIKKDFESVNLNVLEDRFNHEQKRRKDAAIKMNLMPF